MASKIAGVLLSCVLVSLVLNCRSAEIAEESFADKAKQGYYPKTSPQAKELLKELEPIFLKYTSFQGEFSMQIQTQSPNKQNVFLDGRIFLSQESGKIKIQLMDNFMGLMFSELIASKDRIEIKASQSPKPISQPMGDILLVDPNTGKPILMPFPIIYQYLTGDFRKEIESPKARFHSLEKRILLDRNDGQYEYFFNKDGLERIELLSELRGIRAFSSVKEKDPENLHPPKSILTKVSSLKDEKETAMVLIKMKKVKRTSIPESVFQF